MVTTPGTEDSPILRRLLLLLPFIVLVTTWATACSDDSPSSNKATAPVGSPTAATSATAIQPKELKEVKVGYVPIFNFAPLYVGVDKGYFAAEGIKVSLERLAGGADMLVQTAAGNFNVGSGGVGAAAFNAAAAAIKEHKPVPFEIVAPLHLEKPPVSTPLVVSKARYDSGEITKIADLKGKKVSVNARGASTEYWLSKALAAGGLGYKDINLQTVGFTDAAAALVNKSIDGAMLAEPFATMAADQGQVKVLSNDFVNGDQATVIYWNRDWATRNQDLSEAFLRAFLKACADLENGGWKDDATLAIISKYTNVPADVLKRAPRPYHDPTGTLNIDSLKRQEAFFREQGLLTYQGELDYSLFTRTR